MDEYDVLLQEAIAERTPPEKTTFQVFLEGRDTPVIVWARFFAQEGPMVIFFDHDDSQLYPQNKVVEVFDEYDELSSVALISPDGEDDLSEVRRVAAFQSSKIVYVTQVGSTK